MNKVWAVLAVATVGLAGCMGHAEMVKRDKVGGVLALKGDRGKAMEDANAQMAANCPNGFEIVGEEMAKVGEVTEAHGDTNNKDKGKGATTDASSVTSEVKEYRITYQCKTPS